MNKIKTRFPEIVVNTDIQTDVNILGDEMLIRMMINNLLDNAIKYSDDEKEISIDLKKNNDNVLLAIADKGIGIDDEEKKNVFKKFYRIGSESTRKNSGSGLGLYICKRIANIHKATINLKNNSPKGSIFEIIFQSA